MTICRGASIRLKYGRKVALARTMARYMAPLVRSDDAILVPVPLHRGRLWQRGFNQSALVAAEIARRTGIRSELRLLKRVKRTPALKGMSLSQRETHRCRCLQRRSVGGACGPHYRSGRRRADDGKHRGGVREGVEARRCGACRIGELGEGHPPDAFELRGA
jgi:hypothetical protein